MTMRFLPHYALIFSMFLASCLSAFHSAQHIDAFEHTLQVTSSNNIQIDNPAHQDDKFTLEKLCEECLLYSYLNAAFSSHEHAIVLLAPSIGLISTQNFHNQKATFAYLSRAPPAKV